MSTLITGDIHMNLNPLDSDRWNLWPWIREQVKKYKVDDVLILGDLTDEKDRHPSSLVNRFVNEISSLASFCKVTIIKGNHDFVDENDPFFKFLNKIQNVRFYTKPKVIGNWLFLPHTKYWKKDWNTYIPNFNDYSIIFCHHTFEGAKAESGQILSGIPVTIFKGFKGQVYSGDIHVPQILSSIEYVGSPYRIRFGDSFEPRVLLLQDSKERDIHFPSRGRELLVCRSLLELSKNDFIIGTQVKVRIELRRSEFPEWTVIKQEIKKLVAERGWELCGLELEKIKSEDEPIHIKKHTNAIDNVEEYCKKKKLSKDISKIGLELIKKVQ